MNQIIVEYKPIPWLSYSRKISGAFPASWVELTPVQLLAIAQIGMEQITDIDFIRIFTGIKKKILKKLSPYELWCISDLFSWAQSYGPHNQFIMPSIEINGVKLLLPQPKLKKLSFGQFIFIDSLYFDYLQNRTPENLRRFAAALCIPEGQKFRDDMIDSNDILLQQVPGAQLEALAINYQLILEWLPDIYPMFFLRNNEDEKEKPDKDEKKSLQSRSSMWMKIFEGLVGERIDKAHKYADLPFHNVMRFLSQTIRERERRRNKK